MSEINEDLAPLRLDEAWAYKVSVLADLVARRVARCVEEGAGLNLSQWRVLAAIADVPGRSASEVVAVTPMDKALVSRAVSVLVGQGLIARRASSSDGRLSHLFLTADGEQVYAKTLAQLEAVDAHGHTIASQADQRALLSLVEKFIVAYSER